MKRRRENRALVSERFPAMDCRNNQPTQRPVMLGGRWMGVGPRCDRRRLASIAPDTAKSATRGGWRHRQPDDTGFVWHHRAPACSVKSVVVCPSPVF